MSELSVLNLQSSYNNYSIKVVAVVEGGTDMVVVGMTRKLNTIE